MFSSSTKTPEQRNLVHVAAFFDMEVLSIVSLERHFFFLSLLFLGSLCTDPPPPFPFPQYKSEKGPLLRFLLRGGGRDSFCTQAIFRLKGSGLPLPFFLHLNDPNFQILLHSLELNKSLLANLMFMSS